MDWDSGGWMLSELERNLRLCIDEKTKKRNKNANQYYPKWWLILSDHIGYGLNSYQTKVNFAIRHPFPYDWEKIILLNPLDHTRAFEF